MSLRDSWPVLSPRERDAKVAEALGLTVRWLGSGPWVNDNASHAVPPYSTSWEHAGGLLDRLREEASCAFGIRMLVGLPWYLIVVKGESVKADVTCTTGPEAIALAFCLSREGGLA
jgi:hypothetical protein